VELEEALGMLVAMADRRLQQLVSVEVQQFEITPQQFWVVLLLAQGALGSVQEVGRRVGIDKPAASRLVETLAKLGWVRYGESGDSRRRLVELTARGQRQAQRFRNVAVALAMEIEAGITPAQRAAMSHGLGRMIANLDGALQKRGRAKDKNSKSRS
jgi:DNA-binding MarR family transcriptional regulator